MKKIVATLLSLTIILMFSGCSSEKNTSSENSGNMNSEYTYAESNGDFNLEKELEKFLLEQNNCKRIKISDKIFNNIVSVDIMNKFYVVTTEEGIIYCLSLDLPFSDGKNYRKIEPEMPLTYLFNSNGRPHFINDNLEVYRLSMSNWDFSFEYVKTIDNPETIENIKATRKFCPDSKRIVDILNCEYFEKNKIYSGINQTIKYSFNDDEIIEYYIGNTIKTNKGVYYTHVSYEKEFIDSEPTEKFIVEKEELLKNVDFAWRGNGCWSFVINKDTLYYVSFNSDFDFPFGE